VKATLREQVGGICRSRRTDLDITQDALARSIGVSRGYIATIETGRANPTLDVVERLGHGLGVDLTLAPSIAGVANLRQRDLVHVRCSSAVQRRLTSAGWDCRREVAFSDGRATGWIDLLAYERARRMLIVIEIKTILDDVGAVERQMGWYERHAREVAREIGWPVSEIRLWLLALATDDVERAIAISRQALSMAFPARAREMQQELGKSGAAQHRGARARRGLALIDPASRRASWLIPSRTDGRRSRAPYRGYAEAAARLTRRR
jgi:transcriptional regulator with XRE-family HTH domain